MDRVECVTVQVPWSHSSGGATKGLPEVVDALIPPGGYLEGARRLMGVGDASSAIVKALGGQERSENWMIYQIAHGTLNTGGGS